MGSHGVGQVCAQLLWEASARALIDFTPGAGMMVKASFMMNIKSIVVCHNDAHVKVLKKLLIDYVAEDVAKEDSRFAPADKAEVLANARPARLALFDSQRKRTADDDTTSPAQKRAALAVAMDSMLAEISGGASPKPHAVLAKAKAAAAKATTATAKAASSTTPAAPGEEVAMPKSSGEAIAEAAVPKPAAPQAVAGPTDNLAELLAKWAQ